MTKLPRHIKKTHDLVFSAQGLSAREQDLFGLMMAQMQPDDWDDSTPRYTFSSSELSEWLNLNKRTSVVSQIKPVAKRLVSHVIGFEAKTSNTNEEFVYYNFFKRCEYKDRKLILVPNDELKNQFIEYSKGFSLINTHSFIAIKNEMAKRLYEFFSRFKATGKLNPISLDKLRYYLGVIDRNGNVNKGKKCHMDSNYFINNGVHKAVEYLSSHPIVSQEILFASNEKFLGFTLIRKGRVISQVSFDFQWINKDKPIESLLEKPLPMLDMTDISATHVSPLESMNCPILNNDENAINHGTKKEAVPSHQDQELQELNTLTSMKKRILEIESSRLTNKETKLSDDEMKELIGLYDGIGHVERAEKIRVALDKRIDSRKQMENYDQKLSELDKLLDDIDY